MKTLLLMSGTNSTTGHPQDETEDSPVTNARALYAALVGPEESVDVFDHTALSRDSSSAVRLALRLGGPDLALAVMAFRCRGQYDVVFSDSEAVGLPLALLFSAVHRRPLHISVGHRLSQIRSRRLFTLLGLHRQIDTLFVHAQAQRDFAEDRLNLSPDRLTLLSPPVDDRFFRPQPAVALRPDLVCAAGLQWRDYPTLLKAVAAMPDLTVEVATFPGPVSATAEPVSEGTPHAARVFHDFAALRSLYAEALFVVVPLCETDFAAGATTILQAMAMGKAVIATRTEGQTDVIVEGVTGLTVPPGDVAGWRHAIARLRADASLRERLGHNARRWVEQHAAQDRWARHVAEAVHMAASARSAELDTLAPAFRGNHVIL